LFRTRSDKSKVCLLEPTPKISPDALYSMVALTMATETSKDSKGHRSQQTDATSDELLNDGGANALGVDNSMRTLPPVPRTRVGSVAVLKSLTVMYVMYLLCRVPLGIFNTANLFRSQRWPPKTEMELFLVVVSHLNPLINPLLFCLPIAAFKKALAQLCSRRWCHRLRKTNRVTPAPAPLTSRVSTVRET
jgi:hypothetical protein